MSLESDFRIELAELDWHTISVEEIFQRLSTKPNQGLSPEQIDRKIYN